jgi:hypothetical protein
MRKRADNVHVLTAIAEMQVDRYKHFKWTPRTAWLSILFAVAIPSSLYYVANKTDVSRLFPYFRTAGNPTKSWKLWEEERSKRRYTEDRMWICD